MWSHSSTPPCLHSLHADSITSTVGSLPYSQEPTLGPYIFIFFSSTTLCEFCLAQIFLSISSSPVSFVSNCSLPSSSNHSSHRPPILLLAFPSVLLHTVSICIWSWPLFHWSFFLHAPTSPVVCIGSYTIDQFSPIHAI